MYRLISATPSPYARKIRVLLAEKGIPFELETEVPWNADTTLPGWNPLEKLPVLIGPDGTVLYESRFIAAWIEAKHPEPRMVPEGTDDAFAVGRYEVLADGVCDALVLMFFERSRAPERQSPEWFARQERKVEGGLRALAGMVGTEHAWGDRFTMADIATGCLLGYLALRWPDHDWRSRHPSLARLSDRLETRPSFAATRPGPQTIRDRVA